MNEGENSFFSDVLHAFYNRPEFPLLKPDVWIFCREALAFKCKYRIRVFPERTGWLIGDCNTVKRQGRLRAKGISFRPLCRPSGWNHRDAGKPKDLMSSRNPMRHRPGRYPERADQGVARDLVVSQRRQHQSVGCFDGSNSASVSPACQQPFDRQYFPCSRGSICLRICAPWGCACTSHPIDLHRVAEEQYC